MPNRANYLPQALLTGEGSAPGPGAAADPNAVPDDLGGLSLDQIRAIAQRIPPVAISHLRTAPPEPPVAAPSSPAAADPLLTAPVPPAEEPDYGFGKRYNSIDPKGLGYFGNLQRPDQKGFMGEYSIGVPLTKGGPSTEIPSMVPTLTHEEVQSILALPDGARPSPTIMAKAADYARGRQAAGQPVFARTGEQQTDLYPDLPRAPVPPGHPQLRMTPSPSHDPTGLNPPPPPSAWQHVQTIRAGQAGDTYEPRSIGELMAVPGGWPRAEALREYLFGGADLPTDYIQKHPVPDAVAQGFPPTPPGGVPQLRGPAAEHYLNLSPVAAGDAGLPGGPLALADVSEVARTLFPRMDKWGKPAGRLTGATIAKRLEAATDVSPEARAALTQLAEQVGDRSIVPSELHALAQGEVYTPDRIIRRVTAPAEGTKQIPGAPYGVTNARQERGLRERYLQRMETGAGGRDWYTDAGGAIKFYANDDPVRANQLAEDLAITSPTTTVSANTGFGVKGYNQATAGVPVEAGRFPTAMGKAIAAVHAPGEEGVTGLKRTPFAQNLARGGDFLLSTDSPRAVHDIWDAEAHGYMNPDGTPMRIGFGPAQHRWMDTQQDKILSAANQRAVGGYRDWDELRSQASTWTAQQIEAGRLDPADAAKSYADYFARLVAQGSREVIPGQTTGHMPELLAPAAGRSRQRLHELVTQESGIYDPQGRDQIAAGYGGLSGRAFEGPGLYEGRHAPGMQTQVLTGSVDVPGGPPGARVLDEGSRRILDATEATHGLLTGQDASAYSRILPAGSGAPRTGWDVTLPGGTVTPEQMRTLALRLGPRVNDMALVPTPDGIRLAYMDEPTMKGIVQTLGGKVKTAGTLQGNYLPNNWQTQPLGQGYWEAIRKMGTEKFDQFAPGMAERLRGIDARFARQTRGRFTLSPALDEIRGAIAGEGFAGLERLAKKYGLPVTVLAAALTELQGAPPADTSPEANDGAPPSPPPS